jgi:radical SAM protein with 4Fe4S-binding SPASM domain
MSVMERNQVLPGPPVKTDLLPQTPFVDTLPCTIGWTYSRITTDGNVIPCCKGYEKPLGNLYENHFKHIWSDQPYQEFRFKAKNFKKSDVYFQEIGCYKACDNVGHNLEILKRMNRLKPREKKWLEEAAQEMGR